MKQIIIALMLFMVATANAQAESLASTGEVKKFVELVMADIGSGDFNKGLEKVRPYIALPEAQYDEMMKKMKSQLPTIARYLGKTVGVEFIKEETAGDSLMRVSYIQKFEQAPFRWVFYFYKTRDGWALTAIKFDEKISSLF